MKLNKFVSMLAYMTEVNKLQTLYLESVPDDLRTMVFDNAYATRQATTIEVILKQLLDKELYEEYEWFMHEWRPGFAVYANGRNYVINDLSDFIDYIKETYALDN